MVPPTELGTATKRSFPASQNRFAGLTGPASKGTAKPSMGPNSGLFTHGGRYPWEYGVASSGRGIARVDALL